VGVKAHYKGVSAREGREQDEQSQQQHQRDVLEARVQDRVEELKRVRAIFISWLPGPSMGNDQSSQKNKQYEPRQYERHYAADDLLTRRSTSAASSSAFPAPPYSPPTAPPPPPPQYLTRSAHAPPLPPNDGQQTAETRTFRVPSLKSLRRARSHGAQVVPRRLQPLAGTGAHTHAPTVLTTVEEAPPMPMPEPHPAPPPRVHFPVPTVSTARAETSVRRNSKEDPLAMLRKYDTVIIVCLVPCRPASC